MQEADLLDLQLRKEQHLGLDQEEDLFCDQNEDQPLDPETIFVFGQDTHLLLDHRRIARNL